MTQIDIVGWTTFHSPGDVPWTLENSEKGEGTGQDLAEFAGRSCYQSWSRPNSRTASNQGYLDHILEVGHESVLEHATISVYLRGISRSLTHEFVRHRHFSYSQESQRFVDMTERDEPPIIPPLFQGDLQAEDIIRDLNIHAEDAYDALVKLGVEKGVKRKPAREAARAVLPNATETKIVVTGNYRAWRHFLLLRGSGAADAEIRELALQLLEVVGNHFSCRNVFRDLKPQWNQTAQVTEIIRIQDVELPNG